MCSPNLLCPLCFQLSFPNIEKLRRSLIKVANSPIICPLCNDTFLGLDKFTIHLFSHTDLTIEGQQNGECNINLKPDTLSLTYGSHQGGSPYVPQNEVKVIDKLEQTFFDHQSAFEEINIRNEEKEIFSNSQLKDCQKSPSSVSDDSQTKSIGTKQQSFALNVLKQNFDDSQTELIASTTGMKLNESAKEWECDICSKSFTTKYFLKKHKRLHTGEMPYACEICGRTFTFQQSYHKHLLYHNDEKPHVCQTCNRSFKELSTLQNHERIHSGEKPFKCELCGKCFRQRVSFLVHTRIHTGAMPYECTACQKKFRYKLSQRTHKCIPINLPPEDHRIPEPPFVPDTPSVSNVAMAGEKDNDNGSKAYEILGLCFKENPLPQTNSYDYDEKDTSQLCTANNQIMSQNFVSHDEALNIVNLISEQDFTNETSAIDNALFPQFNIESFIL